MFNGPLVHCHSSFLIYCFANSVSKQDCSALLANGEWIDINYSDYFDKLIDEIRKREKQWDIGLSNFIIRNYLDELLFYTNNHPKNITLHHIVEALLCRLGVKTNSINFQYDPFSSFRWFVNEKISKLLHWDDLTLTTGIVVGNRHYTIEEFVDIHYQFYSKNTMFVHNNIDICTKKVMEISKHTF